ncbi:type I methionyl aminopeptidase [Patescibacteria group bacterium]
MLKIPIKTKNEIQIMREGGKILSNILFKLKALSIEGADVWVLEEKFLELCNKKNVIPACKGYAPFGYPPFPTGLCISIDSQSVHCYPIKGTILKNGDLLTIDTVIIYKGYYLDCAVTFGIGKLSENKKNLLDTTEKALKNAIEIIKPNVKVGDISNIIQTIVENKGYSALTEYAGHGIGKNMHEPPEVPCYGKENTGPELKPGMVLAIEPLVCEKSNKLEHNNTWETKTKDEGNFVQCEHTVLVTEHGYEILTK